uniref:RING-type domain-containing protein n=1 Tax=Strigamia maritima TaxID=126957 RepID=T1IJ15_STRMM
MADEMVRDSVITGVGGDNTEAESSASDEPPAKKKRGENYGKLDLKEEKLEQRLGGILCCAVCLDLPKMAIYQCTNGHLMCAGCFTHVLADARLRDETATCPNCRIEISKTNSSRNLAVEKAVSELPADCQFCSKQFPRNLLDNHESDQCEDRLTDCKFNRLGCMWRGPLHELGQHEEMCVHPNKTGAEVMEALKIMDQKRLEEMALYNKIFELLSFEKVTFNDLQWKPYRTDEFIHKLFYETSRFTAFNIQWVVKAHVNDSQGDPTQSCDRSLSYQVILKSKVAAPLNMHYLILKGPFGDMRAQPLVQHFEFSEEKSESPYHKLTLACSAECNKLLASKAVNFRLIMFQVTK